MKNYKVKLDIDGVIRNMEQPMVDLYNARYGTNMTVDDIISYDVNVAFPKLKEEGIDAFEYFFKSHILETASYAEPYPGVKEVIDKLRSSGMEVHIVSYQPTKAAQILTLKWLNDHQIESDSVIFTTVPSKKVIRCDFVIDDCPKYLNEYPSEYSICVSHTYNMGCKCNYRVNNLIEAVNHIFR